MLLFFVGIGFCVYKGVYYKQGQSWQDGCDKICTCDDVTNNLYSCRARCVNHSILQVYTRISQ